MCDLNPAGLFVVDASVGAMILRHLLYTRRLQCIAPRAEEMLVDQSHLCLHHHLSNIRLLLQFLSER